jgi:hypothetical protein
VSLLEQAAFPLQKGDRAIPIILNGLDLNLSSSHFDRALCARAQRDRSQ